MSTNLICPSVQNFFTDFRNENLFQILGLTGFCIEGGLTDRQILVKQVRGRGFLMYLHANTQMV